MEKPHVYIARSLPEWIVQPYRDRLTIEMWKDEQEPVSRAELLEKVADVDGILTTLTESIDETILNKQKKLKIIANMAVGYDNIDTRTATENGIIVTNTPDVLTDTTADLTFGLLMATARRMMEANQYIKSDKWKHWSPLLLAGTDIHHKTIGIVGMGRIGEAVAKRAGGFDMTILYHNRSRKVSAEERLGAEFVGLNQLLEKSDYVVCLAPLTKETFHMFNSAAFSKMKKEAIFINASRGPIVDEDALYQALVHRKIAGAGLDVFEEEPIKSDHSLLDLEQVVCLPHIGSASKETRYQMMQLCLDNLVRYFEKGETLTQVN